MSLAIFDLDHTLLDGDSEVLWVEYCTELGVLNQSHVEQADRYFEDYAASRLDIAELQRFMLKPMAELEPDHLEQLRSEYYPAKIQPIVRDWMMNRVDWHHRRGDTVLVMSATSDLITEPVVEGLGLDILLATQGEKKNGRYTGEITGTPCFREGKVERLEQWRHEHGHSLEGSWFYSDSHNDIPLLEVVEFAVAVTPDAQLRRRAKDSGWLLLASI